LPFAFEKLHVYRQESQHGLQAAGAVWRRV